MARSGRAVDVFFRILGAYFGHLELLKEGGKVGKKVGVAEVADSICNKTGVVNQR